MKKPYEETIETMKKLDDAFAKITTEESHPFLSPSRLEKLKTAI